MPPTPITLMIVYRDTSVVSSTSCTAFILSLRISEIPGGGRRVAAAASKSTAGALQSDDVVRFAALDADHGPSAIARAEIRSHRRSPECVIRMHGADLDAD